MRVLLIAVALTAALVAPAYSQAPPSTETSGTIREQFARTNDAWCSVDVGSSTFHRVGAGPAYISMDAVNYTLAAGGGLPTFYYFNGQALLDFKTTTSGVLTFPTRIGYPSDVQSVRFLSYQQTYDSARKTLAVRYNVLFPLCTLPVIGYYRF